MPDPFQNHLVTAGRGTRIQIAVGDGAPSTDTYVLVKTTAPAAYDYGYVITVVAEEGERERWVLIPEHSLGYQTNRYLSAGNALAEESDDLTVQEISAAIWARIHRAGVR